MFNGVINVLRVEIRVAESWSEVGSFKKMPESLSITGFQVGFTEATHCAMWPASVLSFSSSKMTLGKLLHCIVHH